MNWSVDLELRLDWVQDPTFFQNKYEKLSFKYASNLVSLFSNLLIFLSEVENLLWDLARDQKFNMVILVLIMTVEKQI